MALRLSKAKKKAHGEDCEDKDKAGAVQVFLSCNVAPSVARMLPPALAEALGQELEKRGLKV